jgi:protein-disulfide isomerase
MTLGGAERNARKQKQKRTQAAKAVAAARGTSNDRVKIIVGIVVVVVLAGAVVGGVLYQKNKADQRAEATIAPQHVAAASYPVKVDNGTVLSGKDDAKITVDLYEDFLCPVCGEFEKRDGDKIQQQLNAGKIKVRYHIVDLLNDRSNPPGYSQAAGNAAICAADGGKFPDYHLSLYDAQPQEGGRGYDNVQLGGLGKALGLGDPFTNCVNSGKYSAQVQQQFDAASNNPALQQDTGQGGKGFGTPTVAVNGKTVNWSDPNWLDNLVRTGNAG